MCPGILRYVKSANHMYLKSLHGYPTALMLAVGVNACPTNMHHVRRFTRLNGLWTFRDPSKDGGKTYRFIINHGFIGKQVGNSIP